MRFTITPARSARPSAARAWAWIALVLALGAESQKLQSAETNAPVEQLRIFFSSRVMLDLRDHDSQAAVKAWTQTVIKEAGISAEAKSEVGDMAAIINAFRDGRADAASLPTDEYLTLIENARTEHLYYPITKDDPYEEYLLLVPSEASVQKISDLRGRKLIVLSHHRMSLADYWLDTLLVKQALPVASTFFGNVAHKQKAANVVLPVFFGNADACLITRRGYETMTELNPQVGKRLRVLAASPKLVPTLFCFNARAHSKLADRARDAIRNLHKTVFGQQILTTFQLDGMVEGDPKFLESARELMSDYARLCRPTPETIAASASSRTTADDHTYAPSKP
jgi:phosphonate transport system substrate-binding protein